MLEQEQKIQVPSHNHHQYQKVLSYLSPLLRLLSLQKVTIIFLGILIVLGITQEMMNIQFMDEPIQQQLNFVIRENQYMETALHELFSVPYDQQIRINQKGISKNDILPGDKKYFAYRLFLEPTNTLYWQLQKFYYRKKYEMGHNQQPLCLVIVGNFSQLSENQIVKLFQSIQRQQYNNFNVVLSSFGDFHQFKNIVNNEKLIRFRSRLTYIYNKKINYIEALRQSIKLCDTQNIVNIPIYGQLIGRQVLTLINSQLVQHPDLMVGQSQSIFRPNWTKSIQENFKIQIQTINHQQRNNQTLIIGSIKLFKKHIVREILEIGALTDLSVIQKLSNYQLLILFYLNLHNCANNEKFYILNQFVYFQKINNMTNFSDTFYQTFRQLSFNLNSKQYIREQFEHIMKIRNSQKNVKYQSQQWKYFMGRLLNNFLMQKHPTVNNIQFIHKFSNDKTLNQKVNLAYHLWKFPQNQIYMEAQRFYHEQKYGPLNIKPEVPFCIVADGSIPPLAARVNFSSYISNDYVTFLASISRLEYENFRLVLGLTEPEQDYRLNQVKKFLELNYPYLLQKTTIVYFKQKLPHSGAKYRLMKDYCKKDDYVIPIQTDCTFIGHQPLKILNNFLYKKNMKYGIKLLYTSQISIKQNTADFPIHDLQAGKTIKETTFILQNHVQKLAKKVLYNNYYPFTFKRQMLDQIDEKYFCSQQTNCHRQLADAFLYKAILALSEQSIDFRNQVLVFVSDHNFQLRQKGEEQRLDQLDVTPYLYTK